MSEREPFPLSKAVGPLRAMTHQTLDGFCAQVLDSGYNARIIWEKGPFATVDEAWQEASLKCSQLMLAQKEIEREETQCTSQN